MTIEREKRYSYANSNVLQVTAILAAHLSGQEVGNSIVDILWGDVNPSGKLPYTIAHKEEVGHLCTLYAQPYHSTLLETVENSSQCSIFEGS